MDLAKKPAHTLSPFSYFYFLAMASLGGFLIIVVTTRAQKRAQEAAARVATNRANAATPRFQCNNSCLKSAMGSPVFILTSLSNWLTTGTVLVKTLKLVTVLFTYWMSAGASSVVFREMVEVLTDQDAMQAFITIITRTTTTEAPSTDFSPTTTPPSVSGQPAAVSRQKRDVASETSKQMASYLKRNQEPVGPVVNLTSLPTMDATASTPALDTRRAASLSPSSPGPDSASDHVGALNSSSATTARALTSTVTSTAPFTTGNQTLALEEERRITFDPPLRGPSWIPHQPSRAKARSPPGALKGQTTRSP